MNDEVPPLILAAEAGDVQQIKALLAAGSDVDVRDPRGETKAHTPLMRAAAAGQFEAVEVLLTTGAEVNANRQGKTAADMADEAGGTTRKALFDATQAAKPQLTLGQHYEAIRDADCDRIRDAVERPEGLDIHATHQGWAALPTAVLFANEATLCLLLAAGIDPNQRNATEFDDADEFRGVTALMKTVLGRDAGSSRMQQMQEMLLEAGVDVNRSR